MFKNLKATLDYADNPDKTTAPEYLDADLYAALRYAENDDKTDRKMFVGGINCSAQNAYAEKAFAYKLKYEALKHQGASCQLGTKPRTDEQIAENVNESARQVQRYIRLTHLIPELLELMDDGKIALVVGEALSYLGDEEQYAVLEQCEMNDCTPSYARAVGMKKRYQDG